MTQKKYYLKMKTQSMKQEKQYDMYRVFGDIGGQLGLWMGVSVITFADVGQRVAFRIFIFFNRFFFNRRLKHKRKSKKRKHPYSTVSISDFETEHTCFAEDNCMCKTIPHVSRKIRSEIK